MTADRLAINRASTAKIHAEGQGIWRLGLYPPNVVPHPEDRGLWTAVSSIVTNIDTRPTQCLPARRYSAATIFPRSRRCAPTCRKRATK
jgi:hypothetical protein